ncbi:MAG: hypothetical protein H3C64_12095 [Candidatus Kuenenia stuttgartiensis]|nr:hypothetical protein [Candidatus Kuenenia stuttgartiensis]
MSAEAAALDNNSFGIKQSGGAMPNATISFGVGKGTITEPGLYGTPYIKTANGSINQSGFNYTANSSDFDKSPTRELTTEELGSLIEGELNLNDIKKMIQQAKLARELLNKMMIADCSGKKKKLKIKAEPGKTESEDDIEITIEVTKIEIIKEPEITIEVTKIELHDIASNGIQTTITNGLDAPGTSNNFVKGLFD